MTEAMTTPPAAPFAIGGLGGSGTRATAMLVRNCGCWLGGDLNDALDNLWFTLLFKRASVLIDDEARFEALFDAFMARMRGIPPTPDMAQTLAALAAQGRFGHSTDWLVARLESFTTTSASPPARDRWCWKEPNTHIIIERALRQVPELKYVHVVRDPVYMASSKNRNQLNNWGPLFLDRAVSDGPRDALAYWARIHRRLDAVRERHPDRITFFSHDAFMADPEPEAARLLGFLGLEPPANRDRLFEGIVFQPPAQAQPTHTAMQADPDDLAFCEEFAARYV